MWVNTELGWVCDWLVFTLYSLHNTPSVISSHYARKFPKYLLFPHHNRRCILQRNIFFQWPESCWWWWECCMGLPDQWISCHTIQLKILFPSSQWDWPWTLSQQRGLIPWENMRKRIMRSGSSMSSISSPLWNLILPLCKMIKLSLYEGS